MPISTNGTGRLSAFDGSLRQRERSLVLLAQHARGPILFGGCRHRGRAANDTHFWKSLLDGLSTDWVRCEAKQSGNHLALPTGWIDRRDSSSDIP